MKIEKISDNQIRCTLSHQDLAERELKLSELAYGSEKAKALFRDMMQQASYEFGFEADDIPLMIEAIPISKETLILVITKVDNPDELNNKFSKLSIGSGDEDGDSAVKSIAEELIERFNRYTKDVEDAECDNASDSGAENDIPDALQIEKISVEAIPESSRHTDAEKLFSFTSLDDIIHMSKDISDVYNQKNSVFKNNSNHRYYLILHKEELTEEDFARTCSTVLEYGTAERSSYAASSHLKEHCDTIIKDNAVQVLSSL